MSKFDEGYDEGYYDAECECQVEIKKRYTLAEIRRAYWKCYHKCGEEWFNYLDSEKENQACTERH